MFGFLDTLHRKNAFLKQTYVTYGVTLSEIYESLIIERKNVLN